MNQGWKQVWEQGCVLNVRVTPRSSRNRVEKSGDGQVRLLVTAPPEDGKANAAVIALLAEALEVARPRLKIVKGHKSRVKSVAVESLTAEEARRRLESACGT